MTILLNDQPHEVQEETTLDTFIQSLGLPSKGIAIAIGYEVIPKEEWAATLLADRMELMLIHAVSGG